MRAVPAPPDPPSTTQPCGAHAASSAAELAEVPTHARDVALNGRGSILGGRARIHGNVLALGWVSLLTDISSEMVSAILPVWLIRELQFGILEFGTLDALWRGAGGVLGALAALGSDRRRRHKLTAFAGYALSCASRALLWMLPSSASVVMGALFVDRAGKGVRTPARDALIARASDPASRATAFGVHRAMDSIGWLLGPLVAFLVLALAPGAFDAVLFVSVGFGIVGLAVLALFVEAPAEQPLSSAMEHDTRAAARSASATRAWSFLGRKSVRWIALSVGVLGLASVGEMLLVSVLQRRGAIASDAVPLCFTLLALVQVVASLPSARLADRIGRRRVWIGAHALLVAAYALVAVSPASGACGWSALVLVGLFLAATDGVLAALVSLSAPLEQRASVLAFVACVGGLAKAGASLSFSALWNSAGVERALAVFAVLALAGIVVAAAALRSESEASDAGR